MSEWQPIETAPTEPWFIVLITGRYPNGVAYVETGCRVPAGER